MIALTVLAAVTHGVFFTGNTIYEHCQARDETICISYLAGITDAMNALENAHLVPDHLCMSAFVNPGQIKDVVVAYLRDHPDARDQEGGGLALAAVMNAFPCPQKPDLKK